MALCASVSHIEAKYINISLYHKQINPSLQELLMASIQNLTISMQWSHSTITIRPLLSVKPVSYFAFFSCYSLKSDFLFLDRQLFSKINL